MGTIFIMFLDQKGGGMGLYIRDNLPIGALLEHMPLAVEQLWMRVPIDNRIVILGVIYRQNLF